MQAMLRCANKQDVNKLKDFLAEAKLGIDGVSEQSVGYFLLLENESGQIKGTLGIEPFGEAGLLRSLAIAPGMAEKEILMLFNQMLILAKEKDMTTLILATNKEGAVPFFEMLGFERSSREYLPPDLAESIHVQHIVNVDNSIFLKFSF